MEKYERIQSTCPSCRETNTLITANLPGGLDITCSHCGHPIGLSVQSADRRLTPTSIAAAAAKAG